MIILEPRRKFAIHLASSSGHADIVKILIEAGSPLDDVDRFGRSPLMWATKGRHIEVLIDAAAPVNNPVQCKY